MAPSPESNYFGVQLCEKVTQARRGEKGEGGGTLRLHVHKVVLFGYKHLLTVAGPQLS